ncbi:GGDEF domain-containing protein [uncultured Photobacterium sp.]|uniref:GGDEF domain-containing protein n=1 Tax=uncultured Photobacterium sp. TaxID=173973 RepID=UPI00260681E2|nr:GGDEF domain-containing protein [uncultured Photobacterium sp.]
MTTVIKSNQLKTSSYTYIEKREQTLQKQLSLLFPVTGSVCLLCAFTYFVADISTTFTLAALSGAALSYILSLINMRKGNPYLLIWIFIGFSTIVCCYGFYTDSTNLVSNTIALTIPLLCFFSLRYKHALYYSLCFGLLYIVLSIGEISSQEQQLTDVLQNISCYTMIFIMAHLLARHRNEAISKVRKTATTDFLTGLKNRHGIESIYQNEAARCQRYMRDFSMLLLDIDNLKSINDRYGLQTGDQVLMMLSKLLKEKIRKTDHIARLSSEEFCLLLPNTTVSQAEEMAIRLKDDIANCSLELEDGQTVTITISIGLTPVEYQEFSFDYSKADSALQRAKNWGRNQVVINQ